MGLLVRSAAGMHAVSAFPPRCVSWVIIPTLLFFPERQATVMSYRIKISFIDIRVSTALYGTRRGDSWYPSCAPLCSWRMIPDAVSVS